tara:strand:- start:1049 stop:1429 length:381 start_codon:yes stop_codon:yes gene_type:complete
MLNIKIILINIGLIICIIGIFNIRREKVKYKTIYKIYPRNVYDNLEMSYPILYNDTLFSGGIDSRRAEKLKKENIPDIHFEDIDSDEIYNNANIKNYNIGDKMSYQMLTGVNTSNVHRILDLLSDI